MKISLFISILTTVGVFLACKNNSPTNVFEPAAIQNTQITDFDKAIQNDTILYYNNFKSNFVNDRNVEIWLPEGYPQKGIKYQVLYMHDGQNVFNKETAYTGVAWEMDQKMDSLTMAQAIKPTIVVTAWNTNKKRFSEYMPQLPGELTESAFAKAELKKNTGYDKLYSDDYLKFLTSELRPFINENFQTSTKPEHTAIMGSSMGGLISLYAMIKYPEVYGKIGCVSTHWPIPLLGEAFIKELPTSVPQAGNHKIYFDHGTKTLDYNYEPYQLRVNDMFKDLGYTDEDLLYKKFEGHIHNEKDWQRRAAIPLVFLLK